MISKEKVAIVGGGLNGLTLAYLLQKKGVRTTLLEASSRFGGRIQTEFSTLGLQSGITRQKGIRVSNVLFSSSVVLQQNLLQKRNYCRCTSMVDEQLFR